MPCRPLRASIGKFLLTCLLMGGGVTQSLHAQAPANDNFASRKVLSGAHAADSVLNIKATYESGEPDHGYFAGTTWYGASVWWSWTAPANGVVTMDTLDSDFDTVMSVYVGSAVNALRIVNANDNADDTTSRSRVRFPVTKDRVYQIAVDGNSHSRALGEVKLKVDFEEDPSITKMHLTTPAAVANGNFADRVVLSGSSVDAIGYNLAAGYESGEPDHGIFTGISWLGSSAWWAWTAPSNGVVTISTEGSTTQEGSPLDTLVAVYVGRTVSGLSYVAGNDDADDISSYSSISFPVTSGRTYQIAVDGNSKSRETGNILLHISFAADPSIASLNLPLEASAGNDLFANRILLKGTNVSAIGYNANATYESGEPSHVPNWLGHTLWWTWVAETSDEVAISTAGSSFDTAIAIYTGHLIGQLSRVAANDNENASTVTSLVKFKPIPGQAYQIAVDSTTSTRGVGPLVLSIRQGLPKSEPFLKILRAVELQFSALAGQRYQLFRSSNFLDWQKDGEPFIASEVLSRRLVSIEGRGAEFFRFLPAP